jgi:ribonuclease BN (tRNA processing enzyme)
MEIRTKQDHVLILDAGSGIRRLGNRLMDEGQSDIIIMFTHAHWDHLMGFPFFKPIYSKKTCLGLYGCPYNTCSVRNMISRIMEPPHFPVHYEEIKAHITYEETCGENFSLNGMTVSTIPLSHPNQGVGYKMEEDGKSFVFLTDNELTYRHPGSVGYNDYLAFSRGADLLIHDAEYDEQDYRITAGWGHSVYTDTLRLAIDAGVKALGLFHHNQERTDDAVDAIVQKCGMIIRDQGLNLECFAVRQDMELTL